MTDEKAKPEFSRPIRVDHLKDCRKLEIEATQEERLALAVRMKVNSIDGLRARLMVTPWKGRINGVSAGGVKVTGCLEAQVIQPCSITLDPVSELIKEDLNCKYINKLSDTLKEKHESDLLLDFEGEEPPEALIGGEIDLGEVAAETLALAINPYPRKEGVEFVAVESGAGLSPDSTKNSENYAGEPEKNTFSVLSGLKSRLE